MKVTIYHNIGRDSFFGLNTVLAAGGKRQATTDAERHPLVKVFEWEEPEPVGDILNEAFERFNIGTDELAQAYRARRLRSLSVGDVVAIEGSDTFSVESFGFQVRKPEELHIVTNPTEAEVLIRERYEFRPHEQLSITVPLV